MGFWGWITNIFKRGVASNTREVTPSARVGNYTQVLYSGTYFALSLATVYRCVKLLSESVANLPLQYMRVKDGLFVEDTTSRLHYLLTIQPDKAISAFDFWAQVVENLLLDGNAYIVPVYNMATMEIDRLALCKRGTVTHDIYNDTYSVSDIVNGVYGVYAENEIIHIKGMSLDGKHGVSVLTYARLTLNIGASGDQETLNRFQNGGNVRGIISNEKGVTGFGEYQDEQLEKTAESVDEKFSKGEKIVSLPGQVDFKQISLSSTDMQFLESRKFTVREICRFFGVHPSFVFDDTSNNYKSAEMANVAFLSNTLNPILRKIEPDSDRMTNLGVLFIGKQTQRGRLQNAPVVQCIKYDQYGEKVNKWLWDDFSKNPAEMITEIWDVIPEWQESTEISDGLFRRNIPAYPEKVIREVMANALVHRPYTINGDIFLNIHPDHIEVVNPGRLPLGVTANNILHTTKKRNEHMAAVFFVLHLMEREGSGYDMMYETLLANGKQVPQVEEGDDWVRVRIDRKVISQETIKVMQYASQKFDLKQKQLICLGLIAQHESVSGSRLVQLLDLKDSDALRSWLHPLIDKGIVMATEAKTNAKEYRVNAQLLRDSQYKGRTSLKRVENYRIKELIIEDLKIYEEAPLNEIRQRIGEEIPAKKIWTQMKTLITEGKVEAVGSNRQRRYKLIKT